MKLTVPAVTKKDFIRMGGAFMRTVVVAAVACLSIAGLSVAADVRASIRKDISIPAQGLESALEIFSKERDLHFVFLSADVKAARTTGVNGDLTTDEALTQLLSGTGLAFQYIDDQTVTVVPVAHRAFAIPQSTIDKHDANVWDRFRLAQVDQGTPTGASSLENKPGQDSGQSSAKLEEVVVTAQRREERLIDVPISIVALGTDDLKNRKITNLNDLQFAVPGMTVTSDGLANKVQLRGISNDLTVGPLVGIYVDEADVTNGGGVQINTNTYDLERVEVLRGPQGTLYGEGSVGGTVRFITKSPVLDRFGMTADVASLFTQGGSPGERINTAINIPLIDQELGVRIVGTYDREGGWIDQPAAELKDINGQDLTNVRLKGLWQPSSQFSASFMAEIYRNDRSTGINDDAAGNFAQAFYLTTTPKVNEAHDVYNLTLTYNLPAIKILSTTSYLRERVEEKNAGFTVTYLVPGTPLSTYSFLYPYQSSNDHAWVEELRVSSVGSGPWQWTAGVFYRHYRDVFDIPTNYASLLSPPGTPLPPPSGLVLTDILFKSWSAFGDINYRLLDRLTLGFGVRSFHESQDYALVADYGLGPVETDQAGRFHSVDPRAYVQYKLSRDINVYMSAAKGFRSGGFNASPLQPEYGPEDVRTYELGTKMALLGGVLRADAAIFYTDYKDFVVSGLANPTDVFPGYSNAGNARIKGVEWDLVWRPADQWSLGINGDYLDTRFTRINATSTAHDVGDSLDSVPRYQIASSAERDFIWSDKQVSMRLDYSRRGRATYQVRSAGLYTESDVVNMLGYSANLHWSKSLSLNLFAQNLLNDRGIIVPTPGVTVRARPRIYGVGFEVSF